MGARFQKTIYNSSTKLVYLMKVLLVATLLTLLQKVNDNINHRKNHGVYINERITEVVSESTCSRWNGRISMRFVFLWKSKAFHLVSSRCAQRNFKLVGSHDPSTRILCSRSYISVSS